MEKGEGYYAEERLKVLADEASLKRLALDYDHPKHGISVVEALSRNIKVIQKRDHKVLPLQSHVRGYQLIMLKKGGNSWE